MQVRYQAALHPDEAKECTLDSGAARRMLRIEAPDVPRLAQPRVSSDSRSGRQQRQFPRPLNLDAT
jgi:hypothetical protein